MYEYKCVGQTKHKYTQFKDGCMINLEDTTNILKALKFK